jgi:hypothetical protein
MAITFFLCLSGFGCTSVPTYKYTPTADLTGVSTFYVKADGADTNSGISEDDAFQTIAQAIAAVESTNIKTITIIGTLDQESQGAVSKNGSMVLIKNIRSPQITIKGKADTFGAERAVLRSIVPGQRVIEISSNKADFYFEDIEISGGSSSGKISKAGSTANVGGGILLAYLTGKVTLGSGVVVTNNKAATGGGIAVIYGGTVIVDGATIDNNEAYENGGGISGTMGSIILKSGQVSNNVSGMAGAGITYAGNGVFEMSGGIITGNKAPTDNAGGVWVALGSFKMIGGTISKNTAAGNGAGVCIEKDCSFTMQDGIISENESGVNGAGVVVFGIFKMEGGMITKNHSSRNGGGIAIAPGGNFQQSGGDISGNIGDGGVNDIMR